MELTQTEVRRLFDYNPDTGIVTRKIATYHNQRKAGEEAGCLDTSDSRSWGYRSIIVNGVKYKTHRLIWLWMTGEWPKDQIDHENQKRDDNRWRNLRDTTNSENLKNQKLYKNNKSGHAGVYYRKDCGKWWSEIQDEGESVYLGLFTEKSAAIDARKQAEITYGYHVNHGRN